jgi:hypothetical protein
MLGFGLTPAAWAQEHAEHEEHFHRNEVAVWLVGLLALQPRTDNQLEEFAERSSLAPFVNLDLVRERGEWVQSVVFGVTLGFAF